VRTSGRVIRHRPLTHDTWELVVARDHGSPAMMAVAGQFATIKVEGVAQPRAFSFARDPLAEADGEHTFYIRYVPGGEMSAWLTTDRIGEAVELAGPLGRFTLDDSNRTLLLIAGGSGLSAIKALAEQAARQRQARDCVVLYGARTERDLHSLEAFAALGELWHPDHRFEFLPVLSDADAQSAWAGARGLVGDYCEAHYLANGALRPGTFRAWLCGPPPMIAACAAVLARAGVADKDILRDVFEDRRAPAPVVDNQRCVLCDECLLVRPVADCIIETGAVSVGEPGNATRFEPLSPLRTAGLYYNSLVVDEQKCIRCSACVNACPHGAISFGPKS
jgi:toluene methyl-monooxygenase electron transfer component